ncbi:hypothetical protein LTR93_012213 [Exophiala xenobiotica]|nr:hypothetical protein LTR93_012213 [Exophiala xenobiotica]
MEGEYNLHEIFNFWDSQRTSPLPGSAAPSCGNDASPLPESGAPSPASIETPRESSQGEHSHPKPLAFMEEVDWNPEKTYNDIPPTCLHYSIEWKVTMKGSRSVLRDTEPDVVLAPGRYWQRYLRERVEDLVRQKSADGRVVRPDDSTVVVSVTERSQRDLTKRYPGSEIDWAIVQTQLESWGQYFQRGKKLRVNLSFNYVQVSVPSVNNSGRRGDKRGATSTTQRMLAERDLRLQAEHATSGQPAIWQHVYSLMRCPGPPCHLGPHCWIDPAGKKHYRLLSHHLRDLIRYVEQGHQLQSQDDVPLAVRQQLYAEEQQRRDRKSSKVTETPAGTSSVTINILPGHSHQPSAPDAQARSVASVQVWDSALAQDLEIEGPRDVAVEEYAEWQQEQVRDPSLKEEVRKARNAMLEEGFDLEQIYRERNSGFFVDKGVKPGIAKRFADDIGAWSKRRKANHRIERND